MKLTETIPDLSMLPLERPPTMINNLVKITTQRSEHDLSSMERTVVPGLSPHPEAGESDSRLDDDAHSRLHSSHHLMEQSNLHVAEQACTYARYTLR